MSLRFYLIICKISCGNHLTAMINSVYDVGEGMRVRGSARSLLLPCLSQSLSGASEIFSLTWAAQSCASFVFWEQVSPTPKHTIEFWLIRPQPQCILLSIRLHFDLNPQSLSLYPTGIIQATIYQQPFVLSGAGRDVTMECKQSLKYNAMYWYRWDPGQGLRLMYYSTVEKDVQRGDMSEGYSVSREEKGSFPLTVKLAHANQTALYLCSGSAPQWCMASGSLCTNLLLHYASPTTTFSVVNALSKCSDDKYYAHIPWVLKFVWEQTQEIYFATTLWFFLSPLIHLFFSDLSMTHCFSKHKWYKIGWKTDSFSEELTV